MARSKTTKTASRPKTARAKASSTEAKEEFGPDSRAPDSSAPDSSAPDSSAPSSRAPDSSAPSSRAPGGRRKAGSRDADEDSDDESEEVEEVEAEVVDVEPSDSEFEDVDEHALATVAKRKKRGSDAPSSSSDVALSRRDPFQAYLREIQRHPLLTPEEEQTLTRHYVETQDVQTAARLVTANLRLVIKLAYEYRRAYKNIMDLIQEGNIGLMQAVKRYDPYRGVKLSSYAAWWIRAYMLRFILNNWRLVKLGTTQAQRKLFFNLNKEKAKLSAMGIDPTPELIADRLGVAPKEVVDMDHRLSSSEASLDAPVGDAEGRSVSRVDLLPGGGQASDRAFEREQIDHLVREQLAVFKKQLKGKELTIFEARLTADEPRTLQELGDEFGVSRERVRQLEARLMRNLREHLKATLGDAVGPSN